MLTEFQVRTIIREELQRANGGYVIFTTKKAVAEYLGINERTVDARISKGQVIELPNGNYKVFKN